ncbi:MAG: type I-E CRISPR-associated protein Cse2/CasB [Clostridia bacterium]|nr:type I-E CRISPR-associated protein Cse2/CasB [Clostridia bacterium]
MSEMSWQKRLKTSSAGERAALRRCAGKMLSEADASAMSVFYRLLPYGTPEWKHNRFFTIMCCSCLWKPEEQKNPRPIEDCLRIFAKHQNGDGFYARIRNLMDTRWDDADGFMAAKLTRILKQIKNADNTLYPDFDGLAEDLFSWNSDERSVQRRWAETLFSINNDDIETNTEEEE